MHYISRGHVPPSGCTVQYTLGYPFMFPCPPRKTPQRSGFPLEGIFHTGTSSLQAEDMSHHPGVLSGTHYITHLCFHVPPGKPREVRIPSDGIFHTGPGSLHKQRTCPTTRVSSTHYITHSCFHILPGKPPGGPDFLREVFSIQFLVYPPCWVYI